MSENGDIQLETGGDIQLEEVSTEEFLLDGMKFTHLPEDEPLVLEVASKYGSSSMMNIGKGLNWDNFHNVMYASAMQGMHSVEAIKQVALSNQEKSDGSKVVTNVTITNGACDEKSRETFYRNFGKFTFALLCCLAVGILAVVFTGLLTGYFTITGILASPFLTVGRTLAYPLVWGYYRMRNLPLTSQEEITKLTWDLGNATQKIIWIEANKTFDENRLNEQIDLLQKQVEELKKTKAALDTCTRLANMTSYDKFINTMWSPNLPSYALATVSLGVNSIQAAYMSYAPFRSVLNFKHFNREVL